MDERPDNTSIFSKLPGTVVAENKDLGLKDLSELGPEPLKNIFGPDLPDLEHKHHFLDNVRTYKHKPRLRKKLTVRERKKLDLYKIKPGNKKYESFLPLHHLWKKYMEDIINFPKMNANNVQEIAQTIQKADLHGALIMVTRSKCPSLIGATGIVIQETKNTFKIVTKVNKLKTIPKENTVFTVTLNGFMITIYGNQFQYRASERAQKKFKFRPTVDL